MNPQHSESNVKKYFLVTGASTGIGRACALELDRLGYCVFAGVRSDEAAQRLRTEATERLQPVRLDVTDSGQIAAALETIAAAVGEAGLAGLVNNAGIGVPGPWELLPVEAFRNQLEVNVIGQMAVTQAFLPLLRKGRGRVVNISSVNGGMAVPYLGAYSASKFALEAFNDSLRTEVRNFGIRVSSVAPAATDTPIWEKSATLAAQISTGIDPDVFALYEADIAAMRKAAMDSARNAAPVEQVVKAVVHALTAKRPKTHYYLGWDVRFCFKCLKMISDRMRDRLIRHLIGVR
ncbi:MAG: SDR family NAD(P)-dependent oxidoreductase [Pirellulaceae bacterium]|nr:SDR family NAD(P)-dependent oxidoreductase [Pirellulaceae bacterium]